MELILWRHADAEDGTPDMERQLTAKGEKQASVVARFLHQRLPKNTRIIVSPSVRAQQTVHALTRNFEIIDSIAPGASPQALLDAANWPDYSEAVLLVGHQPALGEAVALSMTGNPEYWSIKKGAIWWLSRRERDGDYQTHLRMVISPEFLF